MSNRHTAKYRTYAVSLIAALALTGGLLTGCSPTTANDAQIALYSAMRTLWAQHMQWTYDTVIAQEIGDFLATANPNWKQDDMRTMLKTHITQTIGYASDILTGDYAKAIVDYDAAEANMVQMADMLSAGIIAQFPDKFSPGRGPRTTHRRAGSSSREPARLYSLPPPDGKSTSE